MRSIWTIRRSATDAKLSGLCGGVARYWGIDPVLVRVGAVLLALSGGIGLILYVAGWLLIPADDRPTSIVADMFPATRKWPKEAWVVVVAVLCFVVFAAMGFSTPFGFGPAIVLALIWYFGYYKNRAGRRSPTPPEANPTTPPVPPSVPYRQPGPATPFTDAADAWRQRMAEVAAQGRGSSSPTGRSDTPTPSAAPIAAPVTRPRESTFPLYAEAPMSDPRIADPVVAERAAFLSTPDPVGLYSAPDASATRAVATAPSRAALARSRSARRLRLVGLVALGLVLAGLGIADSAGAAVSPAVYVAAALLVVGLTLVAATWFGRARGILPVGLVLLLALVSVTLVDTPSRSTEWSRTVSYTTLASLPTACEDHEVGSLTVDLSQLDVTRSTTVCARVEGGRLTVLTPADANVVVTYRVEAGLVTENGVAKFSGTDLTGTLEPPRTVTDRPTLTIEASVEVGELQVQR